MNYEEVILKGKVMSKLLNILHLKLNKRQRYFTTKVQINELKDI